MSLPFRETRPSIRETPFSSPPPSSPLSPFQPPLHTRPTHQLAYDNANEVTSLEALEDLISDPDEMRTQALLVRERILGPDHPDTTYFIRYRGAVYADMGNFDR